MFKNIFFILIFSISLFASSHNETLRTTITEVIATNPQLLEKYHTYKATKKDITIAKSDYYPKLNLRLGGGEESAFNKIGSDGNYSDQHYGVYQNSLTYTHNLFKGFATNAAVDKQRAQKTASAFNYVELVNELSLKMVDSYLTLLRQNQLLTTAKENVEINEEIFKKVQKLFNAGLTTLSEVNKIESSLSLAKSNYVVQENNTLDANYKLRTLLGRELNISKMSIPDVNYPIPSSSKNAIIYSLENNPSILISTYNIALEKAAKKEQYATYYPSLDLEISQTMNKNVGAVAGDDNRFKAMAYLNFNMFNGFADQAAIAKSNDNISREVEKFRDTKRQVIETLNLSYSAYTKLQEQLIHLVNYKKFALKTLTLYAKEYDLGRRSLLDLLSAQNDFIGSKSQIITTESNLLYAKYRILDAMGVMVNSIMDDNNSYYTHVELQYDNNQTKEN